MSVAGATRRPWTREELVDVLSLYCRLPFGKFDMRNARVIALAARYRPSPEALAYHREHVFRGVA